MEVQNIRINLKAFAELL